MRTFSSNLMENHAKDYKNNSRSLYDFANSTQNMSAADESGLATKSMLESATPSAGSLKPSQMGGMDDKEFERLSTRAEYLSNQAKAGNTEAATELSQMQAAAQGALNNDNIRSDMKGGRVKALENMVNGYGNAPYGRLNDN